MDAKIVVLELGADDYRDWLAEVEIRKGRPLPDGDSNDEGAMVGEIIRDLHEYREISERRRRSEINGGEPPSILKIHDGK